MNSTLHDLHPKEYKGSAFYSGFARGKSSGLIQITDRGLTFVAETERVELLLRELQIRRGGASNRLIFFSHPDKPDWSIYTSDHAILQEAGLSAFSDIATQIAQLRLRKNYTKRAVLGVVFLVIGLVYGLFLLKEPVVIAIARQVPSAWERQLGDTVYAQSIIGRTLIQDEATLGELEGLVSPLLHAIDDNRYEFRFHIMADSTLNAFAIPGGHVVVHTGLILAADTPEEVVGVLAHEIAHVTQQHSIRQLINSAGIVLLVQAVSGDINGILALITQRGAFLVTQKFSRDNEREADEKGWNYLLKADVNPEGMLAFFEKLQAESEKQGRGELEKSLGFLGTHPTTQERINRLRDRWKQEKTHSFTPFDADDFKAFQENVRHYQRKEAETNGNSN